MFCEAFGVKKFGRIFFMRLAFEIRLIDHRAFVREIILVSSLVFENLLRSFLSSYRVILVKLMNRCVITLAVSY